MQIETNVTVRSALRKDEIEQFFFSVSINGSCTADTVSTSQVDAVAVLVKEKVTKVMHRGNFKSTES